MSSDVTSRFQEFPVNINIESGTDMSDDEMPTDKELGNGRSRGRSRGRRSRGRRGQSCSGRRGQWHRGSMCRGRSNEEKPQKTDQERVEDRRKEKKKQAKELISEMEEEKLRELVDREPGIIFDLCEGIEDPPQSPPLPQPQQPSWCKCGRCRQMPTERERKCCQCLPRNCVSIRDCLG